MCGIQHITLDALQADPKEKDGRRVDWVKTNNICRKGYLSSNSFERVGNHDYTFVAKANSIASKALKEQREGLALLDCGSTLQLFLWIALNDYIGPDIFNALLFLTKRRVSTTLSPARSLYSY